MWLTIKELSAYLKIKDKTLYYLVERGSIPHYRVGKLVRFKQSEIDAWMETKRAKTFERCLDKAKRSLYTGPGRKSDGPSGRKEV
jgi:excisionase family DNA binding protein